MLKSFKCFLTYILGQNVQKNQTRKILTLSSLCMLSCFKYFLIYILRQNVSKIKTRKMFELCEVFVYNFLCQDDKIFIKIFQIY